MLRSVRWAAVPVVRSWGSVRLLISWGAADEGPLLGRARLLSRAGPETNRYGGNTSCVEVRATETSGPRIIIDAGTGLRKLGKEMMQGEFGEGTAPRICSSATPTGTTSRGCRSSRRSITRGNKFHVYARQRDDTHLRAVFASQTDSPYFPVPFDKVQADVRFRELVEGARFEIGRSRCRARGSTIRGSRSPIASTVDGASVVLRDRHRAVHRHPASSTSSSATPPQAGRSAQARGRGQAGGDARRRGRAVRRRRPRHLRHAVHARGVPRRSRTGATRAPRTRSRSRATRAPRRLCCSTTRPSAPTTRSTRSSRITASTRPTCELVAAAEGMELRSRGPRGPTVGRRDEITLLGRARLDPGARARDEPLRRQHVVRRAAHARAAS